MTSSTSFRSAIQVFKCRLRTIRHTLREFLPFVKRKRYRRVITERDAARGALTVHQIALQRELVPIYLTLLSMPGSLAKNARLEWLKLPSGTPNSAELCLFVTHAPSPDLKLHVVDHIRALAAAGISVVLIINTDLALSELRVARELLSILHACMVRENVGYDFGAWSHAYSQVSSSGIQRLYLVNDSIVGPLENQAFSAMITRIRSSDADLVGLTQNSYPRWHIQSFFLVFNQRLLRTKAISDLLAHMVNLPTKEAVINVYETQLSAFLQERGYQCQSVFQHLGPDTAVPDDTQARWAQLIEGGFPYIKASILREFCNHAKARNLIPKAYRDAAAATDGTNPSNA